MRVLGVDLGERRIGLALSDPSGAIASPHSVVARSGDRDDDHRAILGVAKEAGAVLVVVGVPRSLSGAVGPAARSALAEIAELAEAAAGLEPPMSVEGYDERLTTVVAERAMAATGVRGRERRGNVDKVAAAVMLQGFLDSRR